MVVTGLNSLAYSASHAKKDAFWSLAKEGEESESRCKDAVSTCPRMGKGGEMGRGDTAQLRLQIVLETRSAH